MRRENEMDLISLVIGFVIGFASAILALLIYGRKQVAEAMKQFKVK